MLLYEPSLLAKLRPPKESIAAGTDADVVAFLELDRT